MELRLVPRRAWLTAIAVLSAPVVLYRVALHEFPLGPQAPAADGLATLPTAALGGTTVALSAVAVKVMTSRTPNAARPAAGAAVTGVMLVGALVWLPGGRPHGTRCAHTVVTQYLATLPRTAIIAGDPEDLKCLPLTARRAVVISRKIAPSYEFDHFLENRSRMFAMLRAHYGPSLTAISTLDRRYGATHLWIRRAALRNEAMARDGIRWVRGTRPYGTYVRGLLDLATPVTLNLPRGCLQWKHGPNEIYAIRCLVQRETPQHRRAEAVRFPGEATTPRSRLTALPWQRSCHGRARSVPSSCCCSGPSVR